MMYKFFVMFILCCVSVISNASVINKIIVHGLKRIPVETILCKLPIKVGIKFNDDDIYHSIKILFDTQFFEEIIIFNENDNLIIQVHERPIINGITFLGNTTIKNDTIQKVLDEKKIKLGVVFNEYFIFEVKRELEDLYHSMGKFNATVKFVIEPLLRNLVDIKIMCSEGKVSKVQKINIFGSHVFQEKKLLKQFQLHDKIRWWNCVFNRNYHKQKLFHDLEFLRNFYLNRGYIEFRIDSVQIDFTPDKKNICLSIYIYEGKQYFFDSLIFLGNILDYFPNITQQIYIFPKELYKDNKIREIEYNIRNELSKNGYIQPVISINSDIDFSNRTVKLYMYVDVGECFYVRDIHVMGNKITQDSVIRQELLQMEQTKLNYHCVLKDQERLQRLGYFKSVEAQIQYVPNMINLVDVIYKIEEHNTGNLQFTTGFGTASGLNFQFGMYQKNFLGTGNFISITGMKNNYHIHAEAAASSSFFCPKKMNLGGKIYFSDLNSRRALTNYNLKNYGVNINYIYPYTEYHSITVGLNCLSNNLSKLLPQIAVWRYLHSIGIEPKYSGNHHLNNNFHFNVTDFLLVSGWNFNNLNQIYFPTSGSHLNILNKLTLPGFNNRYYKVTINGSHYISIDQDENWVLMGAMHVGYAGGLYNREPPFYDNFYIGGIETMRGFKLHNIGPKAVYYCDDNNFNEHDDQCVLKYSKDPVGGNAVAVFKAELITPIAYLDKPYADVVRVSWFLDIGTVWDTFWKNTNAIKAANIIDHSLFTNIRISTGVTLKWISPVGPVFFSYSTPIKKYLGDIEEPFQFSIGKTW